MRKLQPAFSVSLFLTSACLTGVLALSGCGGGGGSSANGGSNVSSSPSGTTGSNSSANAAEVVLGAENLSPDNGVAGASLLANDELTPENKSIALAADEIAPL